MDNSDQNQTIVSLIQKGDQFANEHKLEEAVKEYQKAYDSISGPSQLKNAKWILASIGEMFWKNKDYENAFGSFQGAISQKGSLGNPYLHLRLGQLTFELSDSWNLKKQEKKNGKHWKASDELGRALIGGGLKIFRGEDEKYLTWILEILDEPEDGWDSYVGATADLLNDVPTGTSIGTVVSMKK